MKEKSLPLFSASTEHIFSCEAQTTKRVISQVETHLCSTVNSVVMTTTITGNIVTHMNYLAWTFSLILFWLKWYLPSWFCLPVMKNWKPVLSQLWTGRRPAFRDFTSKKWTEMNLFLVNSSTYSAGTYGQKSYFFIYTSLIHNIVMPIASIRQGHCSKSISLAGKDIWFLVVLFQSDTNHSRSERYTFAKEIFSTPSIQAQVCVLKLFFEKGDYCKVLHRLDGRYTAYICWIPSNMINFSEA